MATVTIIHRFPGIPVFIDQVGIHFKRNKRDIGLLQEMGQVLSGSAKPTDDYVVVYFIACLFDTA